MRDSTGDLLAFEADLRAALRRHVANAPSDFDAMAFASAVAHREPRWIWRWSTPWTLPGLWVRRELARGALLLVLAAVLLGLVAAILLAGGLGRSEWRALDIPGDGAFIDVAAGPSGSVAIGPSLANGGGLQLWHSDDGVTWTAGTISGGGTWPQSVRAVAAWDGGFVAVGGTTALVSRDGLVWTPLPAGAVEGAPVAATPGGGIDGISDATGFGNLVVAVGGLHDPAFETNQPAIWTSTDGRAWHLVRPLDGAAPGSSFWDLGDLMAVTHGGPGLVAVGGVASGAPVWVSSDGTTWRRAPAGSWPGNVRLAAVAGSVDGTVIACGSSTGYLAPQAMWISRDALTWRLVDESSASGLVARPASCDGLAATPDGFVVVQTVLVPDGNAEAAGYRGPIGSLWTSADGGTWSRSLTTDPVDYYFRFAGVSATPSGLYVSGVWLTDYSTHETAEVTWVLPGGRLADIGGRLPRPTASFSR